MQTPCRPANMRLALVFLTSVLLARIFVSPCALVAAEEAPVERPTHQETAAQNFELRRKPVDLTAVAPSAAISDVAQANSPPIGLSDPILLSPAGGVSPDIAASSAADTMA